MASLFDQLAIVQARRSLVRFYQLRHPTHQVAKHQILIADRLERVVAGNLKTLLISAPPGSAKSTWATVEFPSWLLGNLSLNGSDERKIISLSHSADLADDFGEQTRDVVTSKLFSDIFPHLKLSATSKARNKFKLRDVKNNCHHNYFSTGLYGSVTGKRADLLLQDDLVKEKQDVITLKNRDRMFSQLKTVGFSRLKGLEATIALQTRWNADDTFGRMRAAEEGNLDFEYVNIPAIAHTQVEHEIYNPDYRKLMQRLYGCTDYIQKVDEPIWQNHPTNLFRRERLEKLQRYYGAADFAALYQGQPYVEGGGQIKVRWFRYYRELPKIRYYIITADTAWTDKEDSSYTVFQLWGVSEFGEAVLISQLRGQWTYDILKVHAEKFINRCQRNIIKEICIEEAASGHALIAEWANKFSIRITPFKTGKLSKETRTELIIPYIEGGHVLLPHPDDAPWVNDLIAECEQYPNATRDQIDAMVIALNNICVTGSVSDYERWV